MRRRGLLLAGAGAAASAAAPAAGPAAWAGVPAFTGPAEDAAAGRGATPAPPGGAEELDNPHYPDHRAWVNRQIRIIRRMPHTVTPLLELPLSGRLAGLRLLLKDETVQPSGSHKHRLVEALYLHALATGRLHRGSTVVEASSGTTAISEAWFSRELGIPFVAVVPSGTTGAKVRLIRNLGGEVVEVPGADISAEARRVAAELGGHFMDQFTYAEQAYDWRGERSLAGEVLRDADPEWFVMGAGTGGTVVSLARHARYTGHRVRTCVTDPEGSAYFPGWRADDRSVTAPGSRIEGIGRPRVEASFLFPLVNRMLRVPDGASVAAMRVAARRLGGTLPGPSTGTALFGAMRLLDRMRQDGGTGTVVTLIADPGERHLETFYDDDWLREHGIDHRPWVPVIERFLDAGRWFPPRGHTAAR
ncbi:PLP-dependent cysteine synthase family protein [Streptomyces sodiiphilus]